MNTQKRLNYAFYTMFHPGDGFYEIRYREKGSVKLAFFMVVLFSLSFSVNKRYASFVVNPHNVLWTNSLTDLLAIAAFYLLFCIANWSISCLMEGEGRLKDIMTVTGYATLPLLCTLVPCTLLSYIIAENEQAFYYLILTISVLWFLFLVIVGIMRVHNYTFGKTVITAILTFASMIVILFVILLMVTIVQQLFLFIQSIYTELVFSV